MLSGLLIIMVKKHIITPKQSFFTLIDLHSLNFYQLYSIRYLFLLTLNFDPETFTMNKLEI